MGNFLDRKKNSIFTIFPQLWVEFAVRAIATFTRMNTYFDTNFEIFQSQRTLVHGKHIPMEKKRYFERCLGLYLEHGFSKRLLHNEPPSDAFEMKLEPRGKDGFMHFDGLQAYVEENTRVEALPFSKLDYLFRIYFALITAILLINLAHYYTKTTRRYRIWIRRANNCKRKLGVFTRKSYIFFCLKVSRWLAFIKW